MKKTKKILLINIILSIIAAIILYFCMFNKTQAINSAYGKTPNYANAKSNQDLYSSCLIDQSGNWAYDLIDDNFCYILGPTYEYRTQQPTMITIPSDIINEDGSKTYKVRGIKGYNTYYSNGNYRVFAAGFAQMPYLQTLNFPDSEFFTELLYENVYDNTNSSINKMFSGDILLKEINLPESISTIGSTNCNGIFEGSYIETINFTPKNQCTINSKTFKNCPNLKSFTATDNMIFVGTDIFYGSDLSEGFNFSSGYASTSIPEYFLSNTKIQEITFPSSIISISSYAFANCSNLTTVNFNDNLQSIGTHAFSSCPKITTLDFSNTKLDDIGNNAFSSNTALNSITFNNKLTSIGIEAFYSCTQLTEVDLSQTQLSIIKDRAFKSCSNITTITVPSTINEIKTEAFKENNKLTSFNFKNSSKIITIGDSAFTNTKISSFDFGTIETIGNNAFQNTSLTSITLPTTLTSIGNYVFSNTQIETIILPDSLKKIGTYAFYNCPNLTNITLGKNVEFVGSYAFANNLKLKTVNLNSQQEIVFQDNIFTKDELLETVVFPDKIKNIPAHMFANCNSLVNLSLPNGITNIERYAFSGCQKLKTINIPSELNSIQYGAFSSCSSLKDVDCSSALKLETLDNSVFSSCKSLETIDFPVSLKTIGHSCFSGCTSLKTVNVYSSQLNSIGQACFKDCSSLNNINFLNTKLTTIPTECFSNCSSLTETILPKTLQTINDSAFSKSGLQTINFEDLINLQSIGSGAFKNTKLLNVIIPSNVKTINNYAFYEIPTLNSLSFKENSQLKTIPSYFVSDNNNCIATINFPNTITAISDSALGSANVYNFEDNTELKTIGKKVFTASVHDVNNFPGTQPTITELISYTDVYWKCSGTVDNFSFSQNSTVETLSNSLSKINTSVEFPDSLKYWISDVEAAGYMFVSDDSVSYFKGQSLDLKNIEYVGYKGKNTTEIQNLNHPAPYLYLCGNLTNTNFNAPKLKFFQGACKGGSNINFKEKCPELKYFHGGYDYSNLNMREWLPDNMESVVGACQSNMISINDVYYFPYTLDYKFTDELERTPSVSGTFVIPINLNNLGIPSYYGDKYYFKDVNIIVEDDNLSFSSDIFASLGGNDRNHTNAGYIYITNNTLYNSIKSEVENSQHAGIKTLKVKNRKASITATAETNSTGMTITSTIINEAPSIKGKLMIYNISNASEGEIVEPLATFPATGKNLSFVIDDKYIPAGTNTFKVKFVSDLLTSTDAEQQVVYNKSALPVELTSSHTIQNNVVEITGSVSTSGNKLIRGTLSLYWINPETLDKKLIQSSNVDESNNEIIVRLDIDSPFLQNGQNSYRLVFNSEDEETFQNKDIPITFNVDGADPNLDGSLSDSKGGVMAAASIDNAALKYGTLTIYLGNNKLGKILNQDNGLEGFISPDQLKIGENSVTFVYETESARYSSKTITKTIEYNPVKTELALTSNWVDENQTEAKITAMINNSTEATFNGVINLYLGDSKLGTLIQSSTNTSLSVNVNRNSLQFGENKFYAEYIPNDNNTSFADSSSSLNLKGKEIVVSGGITNTGDSISITALVTYNGEALDPNDITIYQGTSIYGNPLEVSVSADKKTATATCLKTKMYVGSNSFYILYTPSDNQYAEGSKTLTFNMAADGSESEGDPWTPEKVDEIINSLKSISEELNIDFTALIECLNKNFALIDTDLSNISDVLTALVNKEYPTIPDYNEKFESLIAAVKELSQNMNNSQDSNLEEILTSIKNTLDKNNEYQQAASEALEHLSKLSDIEKQLENIVSSINNGNQNNSNVSKQLTEIAKTLESMNNKEFKENLTDIEAQLSAIAESMKNFDNSAELSEIKDILSATNNVLSAIEKSITNNKVDLSSLTNIEKVLKDMLEQLKNSSNNETIDLSGLETKLDSLIESINSKNYDIDTSKIEAPLNELIKTLKDKSFDTSSLESKLDAISKSNADLNKILQDMLEQIKNPTGTIKIDLDGLELKLDKLIETINSNNSNSSIDTTNIENSLNELISALKNYSVDTSSLEEKLEAISSSNQHISDTLEKMLEKLIQEIRENNNDEANKTLSEIVSALKDLKDNNKQFDTTNIEDLLKDLTSVIENNNSNVNISELKELYGELLKNQNESLFKELDSRLEKILSSLDNIASNSKTDLSGIQNALDKISSKEDKTQDVVDGLKDIQQQINNNGTPDFSKIENSLEKLVEEAKQEKDVFDTQQIEDLLKQLTSTSVNQDNSQELKILEDLVSSLKEIIEQNKSDISGIENSIGDLIQEMKNSNRNSENYDEMLIALNRIGSVLDKLEQNGTDKETMEGILSALNNMNDSMKNNSLTKDDLEYLIRSIQNLKIEVPEPDYSPITNSIDDLSEKLDNITSIIGENNKISSKDVIYYVVYVFSAGIIAMAIFSVSKKLQKLIDLMTYKNNEDEEDNNNIN